MASGKFYWRLPYCLNIPEALELVDRLFIACASIQDFFASPAFQILWLQIRDHLHTNSESLTPRMLSIDATAFPAPRIKIYARCRFNGQKNFDAWGKHLCLSESITCPADFLSTCRDLWTSLTTNTDEWTKSRPEAEPESCLILYELTAPLSFPRYPWSG